MHIKPFLLDQWLEEYEHVPYNLAASTGPAWTLRGILELMTSSEKERFLDGRVSYTSADGTETLREALAEMEGVQPEDIQTVTGASEALHVLFFMAAETDANVIVPSPCFPTFTELPEALGVEARTYELRPENAFQIDVDELKKLVDDNTKLVLVNSPHNPTGATVDSETLSELHDFVTGRGIPFVVDQVYHPIYYDADFPSATVLTQATILGDFSKAFSLSGLRVGWFVERDKERRERYWHTRAYFTISNSSVSETLAETAVRNRERLFAQAKAVATTNLALLDRFFEQQKDLLAWVRPGGGFTAFPNLVSGEDVRPMCEAAAERGVLLAPGDCFGYPSHFRLGFGACDDGFPQALEMLNDILTQVKSH